MKVNEILLKEEVISLNIISDIVNTDIQTVSTVVVALATIVIAAATVFYARLTNVLLREQQKEKKKVSIQEITWFIISPVMHTLKRHIEKCLKKRDYWWNSNTPHWCLWAQLVPSGDIEMMLIYWDFKCELPTIAANMEKYDYKLGKLKECLNKFGEKIMSLPDFKDVVIEKLGKCNEEAKSRYSTFVPNIENVKQILEIIVNNQQLEPGHSYYEFWKRYGKELAEFRERVEVKNYKEWIEDENDNLLALSENIYKSLDDRLMKYRKEYNITFKKPEKK